MNSLSQLNSNSNLTMEPSTLYVVEEGRASPKEVAIDHQEQSDPFVRYKTPQLLVRFKGKFCVLLNLEAVATALYIPADYVAQYLALSQNAVARQDKKQEGHWTLSPTNGDAKKLSAALVAFINNFILCRGCGLPELHYSEAPPSPPSTPDTSSLSAVSQGAAPTAPKGREAKQGKKKGQTKVKANVQVRCQSCRWQCRVAGLKPTSSSPRGGNAGKAEYVNKLVDYMSAHPPPPSQDLRGASSSSPALASLAGTGIRGGGLFGGPSSSSGLLMNPASGGLGGLVLS